MSNNVKALLVSLAVGVLAYLLLGFWKHQDETIVRELKTRGQLATEVWVERVREYSSVRGDRNEMKYRYKIHYTAGGQRYVKWAGSIDPEFYSRLSATVGKRSYYQGEENVGGGFGVVYLPENPSQARILNRKVIQGDYDWIPGWGVPLAAVIAAFAAYAGTLKLLTRGFDTD